MVSSRTNTSLGTTLTNGQKLSHKLVSGNKT